MFCSLITWKTFKNSWLVQRFGGLGVRRAAVYMDHHYLLFWFSAKAIVGASTKEEKMKKFYGMFENFKLYKSLK